MMRRLSLLPVARGESVPPSKFMFTLLGLSVIEMYLDIHLSTYLLYRRGEWEECDEDLALLGTDLAFFSAFLTSFLFNWVGFLLLMCFCHTIAARYGALAGFGLSLAKWTLIVKRSTELVRDENAWLWWMVLAFGFLICVRACTQFIQIKRSWRHLSSSARERLFFFY